MPTYNLMHLCEFIKCLRGAYFVTSTVLGAGEAVVNLSDKVPAFAEVTVW